MRVVSVRLFLVDACICAASDDKAEAILSSNVNAGQTIGTFNAGDSRQDLGSIW